MSNRVLAYAQAVKQGKCHLLLPGVYLRVDSQFMLLSADLLAGLIYRPRSNAMIKKDFLLFVLLCILIAAGGFFALTSGEWPIAIIDVFKLFYQNSGCFRAHQGR